MRVSIKINLLGRLFHCGPADENEFFPTSFHDFIEVPAELRQINGAQDFQVFMLLLESREPRDVPVIVAREELR